MQKEENKEGLVMKVPKKRLNQRFKKKNRQLSMKNNLKRNKDWTNLNR